MDLTYFERRLKASTRMMDAATDPCARKAHKGLVDAYRARIAAGRATLAQVSCEPTLSGRNSGYFLARLADDGGPWGDGQ
jgi:hypothetical protein